ncbi:rab-GTPase-TBC domain-containing protein [Collybia nuda]|uniref:Rab-GTPase-TBC domain-containing protein n=1 Tax=Collybia nuda TaxID=64659 RepID=A0A9P5XZP5_9AGAR|nr:rab-GTPase-TBC domain-containing protein [Collybia nuda]
MALDPSSYTNGEANKDASDTWATRVDWTALRERSLLPGGFGEERANIWPQLLGVEKTPKGSVKDEESEPEIPTPHRDERQIRLDTDRSFVLYPVDASTDKKDDMQEILHELIVSIFRKRPKLHYFQGYHDIVTVLFLTLPPEMQLICAEKISLHRVRDSMGSTLEPVLGLLRVTKNLLRLADRSYAESLEQTSPLPFYALSNILTLFSHDMPTLSLIQHVFDYLLCRPPIAVVYLATAIILDRKTAIEKLAQEDEDEGMGMAHSLLSSLPSILDYTEGQHEETSSTSDISIKQEDREEIIHSTPQDAPSKERDTTLNGAANAETEVDVQDDTNNTESEVLPIIKTEEDLTSLQGLPTNISGTPTLSEAGPSTLPSRSPSPANTSAPVTSTTLTALLSHADSLWTLYPPTHPEISLSSIMGPQSVVFTWDEDFNALPSDTDAEAMVGHPELIVYPYIEDEDEVGEDDVDGWDEKDAENEKKGMKTKGKGKGPGKDKRRARKLRKRRMVERRTMVAGAVLVLGVAMAVYGVKVHNGGGRGGGSGVFGLGFGLVEPGKEWKGLKRVGGWVGGLMAGATERVLSVGGRGTGKE